MHPRFESALKDLSEKMQLLLAEARVNFEKFEDLDDDAHLVIDSMPESIMQQLAMGSVAPVCTSKGIAFVSSAVPEELRPAVAEQLVQKFYAGDLPGRLVGPHDEDLSPKGNC